MNNKNSARSCAVEILSQVLEHKRPFDEAVIRHNGLQQLEERDRNFARLMVMTTLRRLGQIDALLAKMLAKPLEGKTQTVMNCLRIGVTQLIWLKTPPHAAVSEMVDIVADLGHERMKGLVNVVLKRVAKEGEEIIATQDEAKINLPDWLYKSWVEFYGAETARAIATTRLAEPPLDITVKNNPAEWAEKLGGIVLPTGSVRLERTGKVTELAGYDEGQWWVQDAASAIPVTLLGDITGKVVFDLCAAPGGKTAQLAAKGAKVYAIDQSKRRLEILSKNLTRLNLQAEIIESDVLKYESDITPDIVLLDAPCSASGTMRRHPELVWNREPKMVEELADLQKRMLGRAASWLKPQGKILYCVCSLQKQEGEAQIDRFLQNYKDFKLEKISSEFATKEGYLRITPANLPELGGIDGFFAALLVRN